MDVQLHNFPNQHTSFVGRQGDIASIRERLQYPDCRLLTMLGSGGMGKTRLAQEVARLSANQFEDGVYFVPLAGLNEPHELLTMIGRVLGLQFAAEITSVKVQLEEFLAQRHVLIVLDNFEHLLDSIDDLSNILSATEKVKILVTSREALNIQEEWIHHLDGMAIPQHDSDDLLAYSAVRLFANCAEKAKHDFDVNIERKSVQNICELVSGMPLAIEIAATWLRTLTTEQVVTELQQGIDVLTTTLRNVPDRHRSVRAVFDQSWKLLLDSERDSFMKMCVFRGGFTLEAVREVTGATLVTISSLVAKSLLSLGDDGRYAIHELLRQYGLEKLKSSTQSENIHDAHAQYFLEMLAGYTAELKGDGQINAIKMISLDFENIRAAWLRAIQQQNIPLLNHALDGVYFYAFVGSRFQDGEQMLRAALKAIPESLNSALHGRLLARAGVHFLEPSLLVEENLEQAYAIAEALGDAYEVAYCDLMLGMLLLLQKYEFAAALARLESAQNFFATHNLIYEQVHAGMGIGWMITVTGSFQEGAKILHQCEQQLQSIGENYSRGWASMYLWGASYFMANTEQTYHYVQDAYAIFKSLKNQEGMVFALQAMSLRSYLRGDIAESKIYVEQAMKLAEKIYRPMARARTHNIRAALCMVEGDAQRSYDMLRASINIKQEFNTMPLIKGGLAAALWRLDRKDEAYQFAYDSLRTAIQTKSPGYVSQCMRAVLNLVAERYTPERVLEIMLWIGQIWGYNNPERAIEWFQKYGSLSNTILLRIDELSQDEMMAIYARRDEFDREELAQEVLDDLAEILGIENQNNTFSQSPLIEDLTEREAEILGLIIDGLTNAEIADKLVVGVSTVKKHINNLYSKLGVSHRTQAIARARELRLI